MTDVSAGQSLTGERTLPNIWHENYWFRRHQVAYEFLAVLLGARDSDAVLDAGLGEGYGAAALSDHPSRRVVGLDYDRGTMAHARVAYPSIRAVQGNLVGLPFVDECFDAVVSLQVIEHLWDQPTFLAECTRVARDGGLLALCTPNRVTFSPGLARGEKPQNPFHTNEFDAEELVELITSTGLDVDMILGVSHGERLARWENQHGSLPTAQLAAPYSAWSHDLAETVRSVACSDFVIGTDGRNEWLDLLVVATVPPRGAR